MRDEVFRVPPRKGSEVRSIFIGDELFWLLSDVMANRGHLATLRKGPSNVAQQASRENRESVWILEAGMSRPTGMTVVNEAGRDEISDAYPTQNSSGRPRRTTPLKGSRRAPSTAPGFTPGALRTNEEN